MTAALIFAILASACAALSNLFFRKNADSSNSQSPNGYLLVFYLLSFLSSFIFYPQLLNTAIDFPLFLIGGLVGLLNALLMSLTARALTRGPAGLTFAFQNASAVFPGLLLFVIFGQEGGFSSSYFQLVGIILVLCGLFVGVKKNSATEAPTSLRWLKYALACFIVQILALSCIQGRCLLLDTSSTEHLLKDAWFMPGLFGTALLFQTILFILERRRLQKNEFIFGSGGGLANFLSTALLLLATKLALPFEKGILFPCFSVSTIILCNVWANRLYKETFNLKANSLCTLGILIGFLG